MDIGVFFGGGFEFGVVAEVGVVTYPVDDDEVTPAAGVGVAAEHGDIGGESGAAADHDEVAVGGDGVECEFAADFGVEPEFHAFIEWPELACEFTAGDMGEVEFDGPAFVDAGGDGVGPAEEAFPLGVVGGVHFGVLNGGVIAWEGECGELAWDEDVDLTFVGGDPDFGEVFGEVFTFGDSCIGTFKFVGFSHSRTL